MVVDAGRHFKGPPARGVRRQLKKCRVALTRINEPLNCPGIQSPAVTTTSTLPRRETYNDSIVRLFLLAAAVWGIIGMSIGVYAAAEMAWPALNFDIPWLTFSRLRPDHTFG